MMSMDILTRLTYCRCNGINLLISSSEVPLLAYKPKLISKWISPWAYISSCASASATILIVPSIEFSIGTIPTASLWLLTALITS